MPIDRNSGALKHIGGSPSDEWNDRVAAETVQAIPRLECETRDQKFDAALHGLIGIAPQDELEGMMAAQLIAAHAATMACYRCAMEEGASVEQRRENLNQATKLSRAFTALLAALERRRDKAQKEGLREGARSAPQKSAKQPHAAPVPNAMPTAAAAAPAGEGEAGAQKSAKQPRTREIPRERAARLEGLRHKAEEPDLDSLSDEQLDAMCLLEDMATIITRRGLRPEDLRALEKTVAEAKAPHTKPAKQPHAKPTSVEELFAPRSPSPPAAEVGAAHLPNVAETGAHTKSAEQPPAKDEAAGFAAAVARANALLKEQLRPSELASVDPALRSAYEGR